MSKSDLLYLRQACRGFNDVLVPYLYKILVLEIQSRASIHMHRAAAICYDLAIQRLLSAGAPVNCRDVSGETALHAAARNNCLISVRKLLQAGTNVDAKSYHQWTPLHVAARYGHVSIMRELVGAHVDVNFRGFHGWTALHYAARSGHVDATELLLRAGAEAHTLDNDNRTAAQGAIMYRHWRVVEMLKEFSRGRLIL
ncbi:hypothetical protein FGG08_007117 [Glutinoglossum americanum]|uniref:Ankyrin repeat protein n=1 Tax=Glutinoglossum americanum TaxID=1670608 RepID=A0A9P8HZZ2_9PEZI|nr:hypothetical protein FGG08_007117 [Glutinoglossum americanum]